MTIHILKFLIPHQLVINDYLYLKIGELSHSCVALWSYYLGTNTLSYTRYLPITRHLTPIAQLLYRAPRIGSSMLDCNGYDALHTVSCRSALAVVGLLWLVGVVPL